MKHVSPLYNCRSLYHLYKKNIRPVIISTLSSDKTTLGPKKRKKTQRVVQESKESVFGLSSKNQRIQLSLVNYVHVRVITEELVLISPLWQQLGRRPRIRIKQMLRKLLIRIQQILPQLTIQVMQEILCNM